MQQHLELARGFDDSCRPRRALWEHRCARAPNSRDEPTKANVGVHPENVPRVRTGWRQHLHGLVSSVFSERGLADMQSGLSRAQGSAPQPERHSHSVCAMLCSVYVLVSHRRSYCPRPDLRLCDATTHPRTITQPNQWNSATIDLAHEFSESI